MGKRKRRQRAELPLFDLPLNPGEAETEDRGPTTLDGLALDPAQRPVLPEPPPEPSAPPPAPESAPRPVSAAGESEGAVASPSQLEQLDLAVNTQSGAAVESPEPPERSTEEPGEKARPGDRLLGGVADLAIQVLVLGLAVTASHTLGVVVTLADWMPFAVLALSFSFLYWVVPLAFWGQTPGMAWVGHAARTESGQPLSFRQTFLRWLGALLTLGLVGLPLLLALTGRSLSDRLSGSHTVAS